MTLADYILANPEATDEELLTTWNTQDIPRTDATSYTWSGLGLRLTQLGYQTEVIVGFRLFVAAMTVSENQDTQGIGLYLQSCLDSGGIDFSLVTIQGGLAVLIADRVAAADMQSAGILTAIKGVGAWTISLHEVLHGRGTTCTEAHITAAQAVLAARAVAAYQADRAARLWQVYNETLTVIRDGGTPEDELAVWSAN